MELWGVPWAMLSSLGCLQPCTPGQAVRAMPPACSSSCPLPSIPNWLHTRAHFSFWLHDLKAAGGSQGASSGGPFSTGWCGNGWLVPCKPLRRVQGDGMQSGRGLSTAQVWQRTEELHHGVFTVFKNKLQTHRKTMSSLLQHQFCSPYTAVCGQGGWGLAAGTYSALGMENAAWLTNISHFWNKGVSVLLLTG